MLVLLWYMQIKAGKKTIDDVPAKLKQKVRQKLNQEEK